MGDKAAGVEARTVNGDVLPLFDQADDIADHRAGVEEIGLRGHGVLGVDEMQRNGGGFFFGQAHTEALVDARHSLGGNLVLCFVQVSQVAYVGRLDVDVFLVAVDGKVDVVRQGDDQVAVEIGIDAVGGQINEHTRDIEDLLGDLFQQAQVFGADAVVGALNDREVRQLVWDGLEADALAKGDELTLVAIQAQRHIIVDLFDDFHELTFLIRGKMNMRAKK